MESLQLYFNDAVQQLYALETVPFLYGRDPWLTVQFDSSDYEQQCEHNAHAGANTLYPCLRHIISKDQIQTSLWCAVKDKVLPRTLQTYETGMQKVKEH